MSYLLFIKNKIKILLCTPPYPTPALLPLPPYPYTTDYMYFMHKSCKKLMNINQIFNI